MNNCLFIELLSRFHLIKRNMKRMLFGLVNSGYMVWLLTLIESKLWSKAAQVWSVCSFRSPLIEYAVAFVNGVIDKIASQ